MLSRSDVRELPERWRRRVSGRTRALWALGLAVVMVASASALVSTESLSPAAATGDLAGLLRPTSTGPIAASTSLVALPGSAAYIPPGATDAVGNLTQETTVFLGLAVQHPQQLAQLIAAVSTPGSLFYHHYITHAQFEQSFEPSPATYQSLVAYYESQGLTVVPTNDRLDLGLTGTLSQLARAFNTTIVFDTTSVGTFYFNAVPIDIPTSFASIVTSAIGFSNYPYLVHTFTEDPASGLSIAQAIASRGLSVQQVMNVSSGGFGGVGALPQPAFTPWSGYLAYNETGLIQQGYSGQGETVAVVDPLGDPSADLDIAMYDALLNLPSPGSFQTYAPFGQPTVLGSLTQAEASTASLGDALESALDFEMVHGYAPSANILMALAPDFDYTILQVLVDVIVNQVANIVSNSWGAPEPEISMWATYFHPYAEMAAAEGITVMAASGDDGAHGYDASVPYSLLWPASDPYVLSVGGTTLWMNGTTTLPVNPFDLVLNLTGPPTPPEVVNPDQRWLEAAWDNATGGGYSILFPRPSWQNGPGLPTTGPYAAERGVPDIAANAQFSGNVWVYSGADLGYAGVGGTSFACPITAGMLATIDSYLTAQGTFAADQYGSQLGFLNPTIYSLLNSPVYHQSFYDVAIGQNGPNGYFDAGPGWSPVTGVGSPNVGFLAHELAFYAFSAGAEGDARTLGNTGVSASIESTALGATDAVGGANQYFYLSEPMSDGSQLTFGYTVGPAVPEGSWFYGIAPASGAAFGVLQLVVGPNGAAGAPGTMNTYAIAETAPGIWSFEFNGAVLTSMGEASASSTTAPPQFLGTVMVTTSPDPPLGPSVVTHLTFANATGVWASLPSAQSVELVRLFANSNPAYPFANPYGVSTVSGGAHAFAVGSGEPYSTGATLWGTYVPIPAKPKPILLTSPDLVELYGNHVAQSGTSLPSTYPMSTLYPTGQSDIDASYLFPGPVSPVTWTFSTAPTSHALYLAPGGNATAHWFASLNVPNTGVSAPVGVPLTVAASLSAGGTVFATGSETQDLPVTGTVAEFNVSLTATRYVIPANSVVVLSFTWYTVDVSGEEASWQVIIHSGAQYPIGIQLPLLDPAYVLAPQLVRSGGLLEAEAIATSPFGAYDVANVSASWDGQAVPLGYTTSSGESVWNISSSAIRLGPNAFSLMATDLQGFSVRAAAAYTLYPITIAETGLPAGTAWMVTLANASVTSSTSQARFFEPNGTYLWSVAPPTGYLVTPAAGTVTVDGAAADVALAFRPAAPPGTYPVTFRETGLPTGTAWSVAVGSNVTRTTNSALTVDEPNGTFTFTVASSDPTYAPSSATGRTTVNGAPQTVLVSFVTTVYFVVFTESGLPAGVAWSVGFAGLISTTAAQSLTFDEANGTYAFAVFAPRGYTATPSSGSAHLAGSSVTIALTFTAVAAGTPPVGVERTVSNSVTALVPGAVAGTMLLGIGVLALSLAFRKGPRKTRDCQAPARTERPTDSPPEQLAGPLVPPEEVKL